MYKREFNNLILYSIIWNSSQGQWCGDVFYCTIRFQKCNIPLRNKNPKTSITTSMMMMIMFRKNVLRLYSVNLIVVQANLIFSLLTFTLYYWSSIIISWMEWSEDGDSTVLQRKSNGNIFTLSPVANPVSCKKHRQPLLHRHMDLCMYVQQMCSRFCWKVEEDDNDDGGLVWLGLFCYCCWSIWMNGWRIKK